MADRINQSGDAQADMFVWHPDYNGQTYESVKRELTDEIQRDQRSYELALEEAEKEEFGAFNSVRDLEKRWSQYDFGWVELPPVVLADRIVAFERAREQRQELFGWDEWKRESNPEPAMVSASNDKGDWRENISDEQRRKIASGLSVLVILLMIAACAGLYMLVR